MLRCQRNHLDIHNACNGINLLYHFSLFLTVLRLHRKISSKMTTVINQTNSWKHLFSVGWKCRVENKHYSAPFLPKAALKSKIRFANGIKKTVFIDCWIDFSNTLEQGQTLYSFRHSGAIEIFKRIGSLTKLQKAMGHSSINVSLTYLRGLELTELKEEDMPMV